MGDEKKKTPLEVLSGLIERYHRLLWYMALGMCGDNVQAAKELYQDGCERMIRETRDGKMDPDDPEVDFVTQARRHMANRRKAMRSRVGWKVEHLLGDDQSMDDRESEAKSPEEELIAREEDLFTDQVYEEIHAGLADVGHSRAVFDASRDGIVDEADQITHLGLTRTEVHNARTAIRRVMARVFEKHGLKMPEQRKKKAGAAS